MLKAKTFRNNYLSGNTAVYTVFVNDSSSINVISISSRSEDFRNNDSTGLFDRIFSDIRVLANFEYFDNNFNQLYNSQVELKLMGHGITRNPLQPSFRINARNFLGNNELNHKFFGDKSQKTYKSILLRNAGGDWFQAYIRDAYAHQLALKLGTMDVAEYQPVNVFINGEYFGLYNLREHTNADYFSTKYNIAKDSINLFKLFQEINNGSINSYYKFTDELTSEEINTKAGYELINKNLDIDNLIDYLVLEFFVSNYDWLNWNIKLWHSRSYDGRWRFVPHDLDWSFGYDEFTTPDYPSIKRFFEADDQEKTTFTLLVQKIFENEEIRRKFINRSADILNSYFLSERLMHLLDYLVNGFINEIPRQNALHKESVQNFESSINAMRYFANNRAKYYRQEVVDLFNLSGISHLKISSNIKKPLKIRINSIEVNDTTFSGIYFNDVPIEIELLEHPEITFIGWKGDSLFKSNKIILTLTDSLELKAIFDYEESPALVINEIMYKPAKEYDSEDWIELYNPNDIEVDITSWQLKDDNDKHVFEFPERTVIKAFDYLVVVERISKFQKIHPDVKNFVGEFTFGFGTEDMVRLYDKYGFLIDSVNYTSTYPWDPNANGTGYPLELINPDLNNTLPENWRTSYVLNGTPGKINSSYVNVDLNHDSNSKISIFPNPTTNNLFIHSNELTDLRYIIVDVLGKDVVSGNIIPAGNNKIDISHLPKGIYFIKIIQNYKKFFFGSFIKIQN